MNDNQHILFESVPLWGLVILAVVGVALLWFGCDRLTRAVVSLGGRIGIAPSILGTTIVAIVASLPVMATSLTASFAGSGDIAIGNVVGSMIVALSLILGACSLAWKSDKNARIYPFQFLFLLGATGLFCYLGLREWMLGGEDGIILLLSGSTYIVFLIRAQLRSASANPQAAVYPELPSMTPHVAAVWMTCGIAMLVAGASLLANSAIAGAYMLGVGELDTGVTVVAIGTSVPLIVSMIIMGVRGRREMMLGRVVDACVFNLTIAGGFLAVISPISFPPEIYSIEIPALIGLIMLVWIFLRRSEKIGPLEGAMLVATYAGIIAAMVRGTLL